MNKENRSDNYLDQMKIQGEKFKSELPDHAWSRIESRLDSSYNNRHFSFYKLFYNAAMILLLMAVVTVIFIYNKDNFNYFQNDSEPFNYEIVEIKVTTNTYPVYDVHKLMAAYQNMPDHLPEKEIDGSGSLMTPQEFQ